MTFDPDCSSFILTEIPQSASASALHVAQLYNNVKPIVDRFKASLSLITFNLTYNTRTGIALIRIVYKDKNQNQHILTIANVTAKSIGLFYLFDPSFPNDMQVHAYRSFAELLMLKLWAVGINSELNNCDRGLTIDIYGADVTTELFELINIIDNYQPSIEWLLSDEPVWEYRNTLTVLESILPRLQEDAETGRWRDIKPENFLLEKGPDYALIVLRYIEPELCQMTFQIGLKSNTFASEAGDKFIECYYDFTVLSDNTEIIEYYRTEHNNFIEYANSVLKIAFNYHTLYFQCEDGFEIAMYPEYGFQKFCLLLDFMLSWKYEYISSSQLITSGILKRIKYLEQVLGAEMTIKEEEPNRLFTKGFYQEDNEDFYMTDNDEDSF